jgi:hypothetical protein
MPIRARANPRSFGGYTGALCIDVGLLHLEIGQPLGGLLAFRQERSARADQRHCGFRPATAGGVTML